MGIVALYRYPNTIHRYPEHSVYLNLLCDANIRRPQQALAMDVTTSR